LLPWWVALYIKKSVHKEELREVREDGNIFVKKILKIIDYFLAPIGRSILSF